MKLVKKITAFCIVIAMILTSVTFSQFEVQAASLTENGVREDSKDPVKKSNGKRPTVMGQASRVDNANASKPKRKVGLCNVATTVTLLNRRCAIDNAGAEITGVGLLKAINCKNIVYKENATYYNKSGKKKKGDIYSYSGDTGGCTGASYTIGNMSYQLKKKSMSGAYSSNEAVYSAIAKMIDSHPEGVMFYINSSNGCHWVIAYRYEKVNGKTQLYVYDPVNEASYTGGYVKWESSWLYKTSGYIRSKSKVYADLTTVAYISSAKKTTATKVPQFSKSNEKFPSNNQTLIQGNTFSLRGVYSVDNGNITKVTSTIKNSAGKNVYSYTATPNANKYDVNGTKGTNSKTLNSYMGFGKLAAGKYTIAMKITAKNAKGENKYELSRTFTVKSKDTVVNKPVFSKSNEQFPKSGQILTQGKVFALRGVYSVDCGTITNVTATIKNSSGNNVYSYTATPNSKTYDVNGTKGTSSKTLNSYMGFGKLAAGKYTIAMTITAKNGDKTSKYELTRTFTVAAKNKPVFTKSNEQFPKSGQILTQGKVFALRGVYSVDSGTITNVTATIKNSSGNNVYSYTATPNSKTYDVNGTKGTSSKTLNSYMGFGKLAAGKYTIAMTITAKNDAGTSTYVLSRDFTIAKTPVFTKSNEQFPKNGQTLTKGKSFAFRGVYSVDSGTITKVTATVKDANGKTIYSYTATPNSKTYDVNGTKGDNGKTLNSYFVFGKLAAGKHTIAMTITAKNDAGTSTYNLSNTFTIS